MLFDGRTEEQKILDAVEFLRDKGYLVRGPIESKYDIKSPTALVNYFYNMMEVYRPSTKLSLSPNSRKKDLSLAKRFLQSRVDTGVSKERAYQECCEIIETMFRWESYIGLSEPILSMSVLGQSEMSWVTDKVIAICNGQHPSVNHVRNEQFFFDLLNQEENVSLPEEEHVEIISNLTNILERYGTKKENSGNQEE